MIFLYKKNLCLVFEVFVLEYELIYNYFYEEWFNLIIMIYVNLKIIIIYSENMFICFWWKDIFNNFLYILMDKRIKNKMDFNMYMYYKIKEGYEILIELLICIFVWLCGKCNLFGWDMVVNIYMY